MTPCKESASARRKRLLWRASHRGTREMDLLLGGFARNRIEHLNDAELDELEAIIGGIPEAQK